MAYCSGCEREVNTLILTNGEATYCRRCTRRLRIAKRQKGEVYGNWEIMDGVDLKDNRLGLRYRCKCTGCGKVGTHNDQSLDRSGSCITCANKSRARDAYDHLVGQKFGFLTVNREVLTDVDGLRVWMWECSCDCGKTAFRQEHMLRQSKTPSCGCATRRTKADHPLWGGCGEISGIKWCVIRNGARVRGIPFEIDMEYAWSVFELQGGRCAYTGLQLTFGESSKAKDQGTASLDRIDSSIGYVEGNVQWVHMNINKMKLDLPEDRFLELCFKVARHRPGTVSA
jgi:hypothetical protein